MPDRFDRVVALIDEANAADPHRIVDGGIERPAELVYGERMSARLAAFRADASEALRVAARAQHLERWKLPRSAYPMDKAGYFRWRNEQKRRHAERVAALMEAAGYDAAAGERVQSLVRKENLKRDAEAQALEDVACLVFLEHYLADFAAGRDAGQLADIVAKTWRKMSAAAHRAALDLLPALPADLAATVTEGVRQADEAAAAAEGRRQPGAA